MSLLCLLHCVDKVLRESKQTYSAYDFFLTTIEHDKSRMKNMDKIKKKERNGDRFVIKVFHIYRAVKYITRCCQLQRER